MLLIRGIEIQKGELEKIPHAFFVTLFFFLCASQSVAGRTLKQGALGQERRSAATSFGRVGTALSARRGHLR